MFVPLHVHTVYSYLDGFCKIPDLVEQSLRYGMQAISITDHNHLAGIPEFKAVCEKMGQKPQLGMEGYYTLSTEKLTAPLEERHAEANKLLIEDMGEESFRKLKSKELTAARKPYMYDTKGYHILFLARDQEGWQNLVKLQSEASRLGTFNGRFHCDQNLLEKYHKGIICTTACVASYPGVKINDGQEEFAIDYIKMMQNIFGEDFYLEIQPWNNPLQHKVNLFYLKYSKEHNIRVVATNDSHWIRPTDYQYHNIMLRAGLKKKINEECMGYDSCFWLKPEEEMAASFELQIATMKERNRFNEEEYRQMYKDAIQETGRLSDKVESNIRLSPGYNLFPVVKTEDIPEITLQNKARIGLEKYLEEREIEDKEKYRDQLTYELEVINEKGFAPYFLVVDEMISWCRENGIATGPGRGSAAGSLVLFSLGITKEIDPLKYHLLFSRFLTKMRKAIPDVDVDLSKSRRQEVIEHLKDYYGSDHVSHIGNYSMYGVKSSIKDVARVYDIPFVESLQISKDIDSIIEDPNLSFSMLDSFEETNPSLYQTWKMIEDKYSTIIDVARRLEGIPRQAGIHASGILVTPEPVRDIIPVRYEKGVAISLWDGITLDELGFCKLDLLGLASLDTISEILKLINPIATFEDLYKSADLYDEAVYSMIKNKRTDAVFQLESNIMKQILSDLKPDSFEDIVAANALVRPGPLSCKMHEDYSARKHGEKPISYVIRDCESILDSTYGVICYQEQLMQISKKIAGFDDMQADILTRKCIAKKVQSMWHMLVRCHTYGKKNEEGPPGWEENDDLPWYDPKEKYGAEIPGAISKGYTKEEIIKFFHDIEEFSSYVFNRSHSATYSYISFLMAWLKTYYPAEFWCGVLSTEEDKDKRKAYITCMISENKTKKNNKINIRCPDIRRSKTGFTIDGNNIYFGLGSIQGVGEVLLNAINESVEKFGSFTNLDDFRSRFPKRILRANVLANMIKAGCFDFENPNRNILLNSIRDPKDKKAAPLDPDEWADHAKNLCIAYETEVLNIPVSYIPWWQTIQDNTNTGELIVEIRNVTQRIAKSSGNAYGEGTFYYEAEDFTGACVLWPRTYTRYKSIKMAHEVSGIYKIKGTKDKDKLFVNYIERYDD